LFVAQAHSFAQQARLAITLAWVAGYTNIIAILSCHTVVSHASGTTSNLGRDLAEQRWGPAAFALFLLVTFLLGAMLSAFATEWGRRRAWESIYIAPILLQALMLAVFALGLEFIPRTLLLESAGSITYSTSSWSRYVIIGAASAAMGLQNATITRISNGVVRTTHVTGVLTDLGLELVQLFLWIRDRARNTPPGTVRDLEPSLRTHPTARRLALLASIIGTFALGAGLGTLAFDHFQRWAMFPPVLFLLWIVYQDAVAPIAEIEISSALGSAEHLNLPPGLGVFHLNKDRARRGKVHRMPNLLAWIDRLEPTTRVVILDLDQVTQLDANAAMELRAALSRLARQGRKMVIAGLNGAQYEQLRRAGTGELLDPMSVCPDLELAVARGMNLLAEKE